MSRQCTRELNQHSNVKFVITPVIEKHSWRGTCLNTMEILSNAICVNFQRNIEQRLSTIWKLMDQRISCVKLVTTQHIQDCSKQAYSKMKIFKISRRIVLELKKILYWKIILFNIIPFKKNSNANNVAMLELLSNDSGWFSLTFSILIGLTPGPIKSLENRLKGNI